MPWRCLGFSLYCSDEFKEEIEKSDVNWQVTIFPAVRKDILLFLGSCWTGGFFSLTLIQSLGAPITFTAMQLVRALWTSNAFGIFNFQNLQAPLNTSSMVEVLAALSMMNAATVAVDGASSFCEFFLRLLSQLEIKCSSLPNEMQYDEAFQGLMIPRFVFPGTSSDCSCLDNIGIYERSANAENITACRVSIAWTGT